MRHIIAYILVALSTLICTAVEPSDSAVVYFRKSHRQFDPTLGNNRASMNKFIDCVRDARKTDNVDHIVVRAYASPDGQYRANNRLTGYRCEEITNYITDNTGIDRSQVQSMPEGIAWSELRRIVAADKDVPAREKVLAILDNTPVWVYDDQGRIVDSRKKQLQDLDGGRPYRWMYEHIFPVLRNAVAVSLYLKSDVTEAVPASAPIQAERPVATESEVVIVEVDSAAVFDETLQKVDPLHRFALKTNLIYDALLTPNFELQWRINPLWSLSLEANVAWWSNDRRHKYYQIMMISPEVRRFVIPRGEWHGMYVGAFLGGGKYDLENGNRGYKGEGGMAGVSVGYMWPISRTLSLEAGLGLGYMFTRYKEYQPYDGHYLYQRTKDLNYVGPLKVKFALAWRFNDINKTKKVNPAL